MKPNSSVSVVIPAAGNSSRMGSSGNKQFLSLSGIPVLAHTLFAFTDIPAVKEIIIVTRKEDIPHVESIIKEYEIPKIKTIISGGSTRQESVFLGLQKVDCEKVLIHDGARPFVTKEEVCQVIDALETCPAAALGVPVKDTVKRITDQGIVAETLPREELVQIQTPQGFISKEILAAHEKAAKDNVDVTDDCALAEYISIPVLIVPGSYRNIKITTPEDILLAQALQS